MRNFALLHAHVELSSMPMEELNRFQRAISEEIRIRSGLRSTISNFKDYFCRLVTKDGREFAIREYLSMFDALYKESEAVIDSFLADPEPKPELELKADSLKLCGYTKLRPGSLYLRFCSKNFGHLDHCKP